MNQSWCTVKLAIFGNKRRTGRFSRWGAATLWMIAVNVWAQKNAEYRLENLGLNVNSKYEEGYPFLAPDGKTLYFARNKHPENVGGTYGVESNYDVWVSQMQADGSWTPAVNFGKPINNLFDNGVVGVSQDGNVLLLLNTYEQGAGSSPLAYVRRTATGWSDPKPMPMAGHKAQGYYDLMLAADGQTLLMMMENPAGKGGDYDLYVSFLQPDSTWTRPQTLGQPVCTPAPEARPFLALDGRTLYFARKVSDPKPNVEIFMTKRLDDSWRKWTTPRRLPPPVNSKHDDVDFVVPPNAEFAFVTSKQHSFGHLDIFKTTLPPEFRPEPVVVVKGYIFDDDTGLKLQAEMNTVTVPSGRYNVKGRTDPRTGEYTLVLPAGAKYKVAITPLTGISYTADSLTFDLTDATSYREERRDVRLYPRPTVFVGNIFDAGTRNPVRAALRFIPSDEKAQDFQTMGSYRVSASQKNERVRFILEADGYETLDSAVFVRPELRGKIVENHFPMLRNGYVLKGRLFNGATGHEIAGSVKVTDAEGETYFSAAPYRLALSHPGECVIEAWAQGYDRKVVPIVFPSDSTVITRDIYLKAASPIALRGRTVDAQSLRPLSADVVYSMSDDPRIFGGLFTNADGKFQAQFDAHGEYLFMAKKDGYLPAFDKIVTPENGDAQEIVLRLQPIVEGATVRLDFVYFAFADSSLLPESRAQLAPLAELLLNAPTMRVEISGHTDYVGGDVNNQRLSLSRAAAVKKFFVDAGVAESRLEARGYGETRPVASNKTAEGRRLNRRVEFKILAK